MAVNSLLLVACVCISIASFLFLFYWNRLIALVLSVLIRLATWKRDAAGYWVKIGSIHVSLAAGRVLLKDVQYHSSNQSIKVVKVQITWRYWIRQLPFEEELSNVGTGEEDVNKHRKHSTSPRILLSLQGFEWFLVNRTSAYDAILSQIDPDEFKRSASRETRKRPPTSEFSEASHRLPLSCNFSVLNKLSSWVKFPLPNIDFKEFLPVGIEVMKGAISCGNASCPELLVAQFRKADGDFSIAQARSKHDMYKRVLSLKFQQALIRYVQNEEFQDPMFTTGRMVDEHIKGSQSPEVSLNSLLFSRFVRLWRRLRIYDLLPIGRGTSKTPLSNSGPSRSRRKSSLDEETPVGADFSVLEYAVERKILEAPLLDLSYYIDVVGEVPAESVQIDSAAEPYDIGNGDLPPEWGVDIVVQGGFLRYGPWADRQRVELQRTFFPASFRNLEPTVHLKPGDKRVWTSLNTFIELRGETTLYIPFREASKNWQWDGRVPFPRPRKREPASVHFKAGNNSTISYIMPMVASPTGYSPHLEMHLDSVEVTSPLNDIKLLVAQSCRIQGDLPTPLKWNDERQWTYAISLQQPVFYLLRDHINLFIDLAKDWSSGPGHDYFRFIPTIYAVEIELHPFELNLYANDHNIVDKPLIKDENALFSLRGHKYHVQTQIPANTFRPTATTVPVFTECSDVSLFLSLPRWTTHTLGLHDHGIQFAHLGLLRFQSSYRYFSCVKEENIEQLTMNITARDVAVKILGWTIRYFIVLRENYLGSFTHFSTLYEYLERRRNGLPTGDPVNLKYRPEKVNVLQVELAIFIENLTESFPAGLPGYERHDSAQGPSPGDFDIGTCIVLTTPALQCHIRLHDFFMEMTANVDTVSGCIQHQCLDRDFFTTPLRSDLKEAFLIDGLDIAANRLFGPQPRTATYFCMWEIHLGDLKGTISTSDSQIFMAAMTAFRLNFVDKPNAPAKEYSPPLDPDVIVIRVSIDSIDIVLLAGQSAVVVAIPEKIRLTSNNRAGQMYYRVTSFRLPQASLKLLLGIGARPNSWMEALELSFDISGDIYSSPPGWEHVASAQKIFVETQDALTGRVNVLFDDVESTAPSKGHTHLKGLFIPQPTLPCLDSNQPTRDTAAKFQELSPDRLWPWSTQALNLSESEDEERVSEADRDARLARTRSTTIITREDEQELSSGDESDDGDLTDSSTSDSDRSEAKPGLPQDKALIGSYRNISRRYTAKFSHEPSSWAGPSLTLAHADEAPQDTTVPRRFTISPNSEWHVGFQRTSNTETFKNYTDLSRTVIQIESCEGINLTMTPLIVPALAQFEREFESSTFSPEMCIDSFLADFLGAFPKTSSARLTVLDLHLSSFRMCSTVRIPLQNTETFSEVQNLHPLCDDTVAITVLSCCQLHLSGSVADNFSSCHPTWSSNVEIDQISLALHSLCEQKEFHHRRSPTYQEAVFLFNAFDLRGNSTQSSARCDALKVALEFDHCSPEYLVATGNIIFQCITDLIQISNRWKRHDMTSKQRTIFHLLKCSQNKRIIDPLSTTQPSYLVQSGLPNKLRTDINFRFLCHLRICLRHLEGPDREEFLSDYFNVEDVVGLVERRFVTLSLDSEISSAKNLGFLNAICPDRNGQSQYFQNLLRLPLSTFTIRIDHILWRVQNQPTMPHSKLSVAPFIVSICLRNQELVHTFPSYPHTFSRASVEGADRPKIWHIAASVSIGELALTVFPHLMQFAQQILRVRRSYDDAVPPPKHVSSHDTILAANPWAIHTSITFVLNQFNMRTVAENLTFELKASDIAFTSALYFHVSLGSRLGTDSSMNHSFEFGDITLRARSPTDIGTSGDVDVLASIVVRSGKANVIVRHDAPSDPIVRGVWSIQHIRFSVPRSAIRLYRFIEEWRADFLSGLEATAQALLSEVQRASVKPINQHPTNSPPGSLLWSVHGSLGSFSILLQVMHGTWLSWELNSVITYMRSSKTKPLESSQAFGLQICSQVFSISSNPTQDVILDKHTHLEWQLPTVSVTGHRDQSRIQLLACLEFFHVKLKPSHWDTLLAVQQKFGNDFNDLVLLIGETRPKQAPTAKSISKHEKSWKFSGFLKIRGIRIGLQSKSSTVYLECEDIDGGIDTPLWQLKMRDLALSLAPLASSALPEYNERRNRRSAFVIIDFKIDLSTRRSFEVGPRTLGLVITKIHAVMHPSSIGEVGDFIDDLQAGLFDRREQRALQLAAFKEKTKQVLQTFDVKLPDEESRAASLSLQQYDITVTINNIGVAFPLSHHGQLKLPLTGTMDRTAVRAFLISIKSLAFGVSYGQTGEASMTSFSFQFIPKFRQSLPSDFSGETHNTFNRVVYPKMTASLRSHTSDTSRQFWIAASVSGFVLDIDSSISDYVFSLVDVYQDGKERVEKLAASIPRQFDSSEPAKAVGMSMTKSSLPLPTSSILASLTFFSGKIRLFSNQATSGFRFSQLGSQAPTDERLLDLGVSIFTLPVVSVWMEYRAAPALGVVHDIGPSTLMLRGTIHSSGNTLRPTLLPFLTELVNQLETRMRQASRSDSTSVHLHSPAQHSNLDNPVSIPEYTMHISLALRIDQSKLELTCQPDVNVIAGVQWTSGGFVFNISPGSRQVTFIGSIGGLSVGLKHGFLTEECVRLDARNLGFSVTLSKTDVSGKAVSSISVVLDTEFSGAARFSRLQDILCFKAVWLDRIPVFTGYPDAISKALPTPDTAPPSEPQTEFATLMLVRLRQIKLDVDLGQSISTLTMDLKNAVLRTNLMEDKDDVSLLVTEVTITATGNVSGHINVPDCIFQTIRRRENLLDSSTITKMLRLYMTSGALVATLESEHQTVLQYRADPVEIEIYDDWSMISAGTNAQNHPLRLSFNVVGTEIVIIITISTIPKLWSYANKFLANLEAQHEGARRESKAFSLTRSIEPNNPLSAVANAMLDTARSKFQGTEFGFSHAIQQIISLRLHSLRMVVFPRTMGDGELAQFVGVDVFAQLDRLVLSSGLCTNRDVHLSFDSTAISKFSQLNHRRLDTQTQLDGKTWLSLLLADALESIIVGLPAMDMRMVSEESAHAPSTPRKLLYDFHSRFMRDKQTRDHEDIFITLNMSLYSWLTVLRKSLSREIAQMQNAAEWRGSSGSVPLYAPLHFFTGKKKAVELGQERSAQETSSQEASRPEVSVTPSESTSLHTAPSVPAITGAQSTIYQPRARHIERLTMRQLGEATPDVMHPFFMKTAGFNLEESLPVYVNEYATAPLEKILEGLFRVYSQQLKARTRDR